MRIIDTFCKVCTILFLLDILMKQNPIVYNNLTNNLILYLSTLDNNSYIVIAFYNFIHFYSKIQIYYNCYLIPKIKYIHRNAIDLLEKYKLIDNLANYNILFYEQNVLVQDIQLSNRDEMNTIIQKMYKNGFTNNDLLIVSDSSNSRLNPIKNMKIYYEDEYTVHSIFNYELSNVKFLHISIMYINIIYEIKLLTDKYNFYIVGNKIDKLFILYYLTFILNADITNINFDEVKYSLDLCDNNASFIKLNQDDILIIKKDSYDIILKETKTDKDDTLKEETIKEETLKHEILKEEPVEEEILEDEFVVT